MDEIHLASLGLLRTPFTSPEAMPIQPAGARGTRGRAELKPEYVPGLRDLEGFSHLILLYRFHQAGPVRLEARPFLDDPAAPSRGVFATRAPCRPNGVGLSVVRLLAVSGHVLELEDVDMLDGSPLLDIKPYVPAFDCPPGPLRLGWLEDRHADAAAARSDGRFGERSGEQGTP